MLLVRVFLSFLSDPLKRLHDCITAPLNKFFVEVDVQKYFCKFLKYLKCAA